MKKFFLILISSLVLSSCSTNSKSTQSFEPVSCSGIVKQHASNVPALNIELPCTDGRSSVVLNEVRGPAIINAWASWCNPCREEIPVFKELAQLISGKIQIIGIDVEERNKEEGINFAAEMGMSWPQLFDQDDRTKSSFGMGIPVTLFIDGQGKVVYKKTGPLKDLTSALSIINTLGLLPR